MTKAAFFVGLHDLEDGPRELTGAITSDWLRHILADCDVEPTGDDSGKLEVTLTKTGLDVLVQGYLETTVSVPCARTLDPAVYKIRPEIFLMLSPAPKASSSGGASSSDERRRGRGDRRSREQGGKNAGKSNAGWESDPLLSSEGAAEDTYSGDQIVLDHFLREFILLEVPMIPVREDLRDKPFEANPPLPGSDGTRSSAEVSPTENTEKPLDPRFSALAELKARLEKKE